MVAAVAATNTNAARAMRAAGRAVAKGAAATCVGLLVCSVGMRGARTWLTCDWRLAATALWTPLSIALSLEKLKGYKMLVCREATTNI